MLHEGYLGRKFLRDDREIRSVVRELVDKVCAAVARESNAVDGVSEDRKSSSKTTISGDSTNNELNAETVNKTDASM